MLALVNFSRQMLFKIKGFYRTSDALSKISDQIITLNQAEAWRFLFESARGNTFTVSKEMACKIHHIAAKEEALTWGAFRTGSVRISGTEYTPPPFT